MRKLCLLLLSISSISLAQTTGYGYVPRNVETSQVNYAKVGQDINNTINNYLEQREANARALGWSSAAEMDAAIKEEKERIKREKKREKERKRENKEKEKVKRREEALEKEIEKNKAKDKNGELAE
jgi:Skp family chaperone for outer membrane proteins